MPDEFTRKIKPLSGTAHKTSAKLNAAKAVVKLGTDFTSLNREVILMHVYCAEINSTQSKGTSPCQI
jgi:hypothetical protein